MWFCPPEFVPSLASICGLIAKRKVGIRGITVDVLNFSATWSTLDRENQYPFLDIKVGTLTLIFFEWHGDFWCIQEPRLDGRNIQPTTNSRCGIKKSANSGKHDLLAKGGIVSTFLFTRINGWNYEMPLHDWQFGSSHSANFGSMITVSPPSYHSRMSLQVQQLPITAILIKIHHCNGIQLALLAWDERLMPIINMRRNDETTIDCTGKTPGAIVYHLPSKYWTGQQVFHLFTASYHDVYVCLCPFDISFWYVLFAGKFLNLSKRFRSRALTPFCRKKLRRILGLANFLNLHLGPDGRERQSSFRVPKKNLLRIMTFLVTEIH